MNLATLDHDLKVYLLKGQFARHALRYQPPSTGFPVREQQLSTAEVHTLWARLLPDEQSANASAELAEALKEEPTLAEAYYHRGLRALEAQQHDAAARDFTAAINLSPNEPRHLFAQLNLALSQYRSGPEQDRAKLSEQAPLVERLLQRANSPMQFRGLADYFKALGRSDQALDAARKAINLDPINSWSLDTYARILSDQDRHDEALSIQRHAVDFLPEDSVSPEMLDFLRRLQTSQ